MSGNTPPPPSTTVNKVSGMLSPKSTGSRQSVRKAAPPQVRIIERMTTNENDDVHMFLSPKAAKVKRRQEASRVENHAPIYSNKLRILTEVMNKEQHFRENFENNHLTLIRPRNPLIGEDKSRDKAEFLVPIETTLKHQQEYEKFKAYIQVQEEARQAVINPHAFNHTAKLHKVTFLRTRKDALLTQLDTVQSMIKIRQDTLRDFTCN